MGYSDRAAAHRPPAVPSSENYELYRYKSESGRYATGKRTQKVGEMLSFTRTSHTHTQKVLVLLPATFPAQRLSFSLLHHRVVLTQASVNTYLREYATLPWPVLSQRWQLRGTYEFSSPSRGKELPQQELVQRQRCSSNGPHPTPLSLLFHALLSSCACVLTAFSACAPVAYTFMRCGASLIRASRFLSLHSPLRSGKARKPRGTLPVHSPTSVSRSQRRSPWCYGK